MGITHVAMDDSKRVIVARILRPDTTEPELREIPNEARHIRRLFERLTREGPVRACYETGVSGYDRYWQVIALGVDCQVMAPALTPRRAGERVKTDRRDAAKLVRLFRAGELTAIHIPTEAQEGMRDLVRCRDDVRADIVRWRHRLLKFLARHGRSYHEGRNWTHRRWIWIRRQHFDVLVLQRTLGTNLLALEQALARRAALDHDIEVLAQTTPYRDAVGHLCSFREIKTLSAMVLLAELVDFHRFRRPREVMAYVGLIPSEYSSGEHRGSVALPLLPNL